jgi:hypothetical protein
MRWIDDLWAGGFLAWLCVAAGLVGYFAVDPDIAIVEWIILGALALPVSVLGIIYLLIALDV